MKIGTLLKIIRVVIGCILLLVGTMARAEQELDTLATFTGDNGMQPGALVETSEGNLYGATLMGGKNNLGTIFRIVPGQDMETVVNFNGENGASPSMRLVVTPDGSVYGTTQKGGAHNLGTVFRVRHDGSLETLVSFDESSGGPPQGDIVIDLDGTVYGCTDKGGTSNKGTIFKVSSDHQIHTVVNFTGENGAYPQALFKGSDGLLRGVTCSGGSCDSGTLFSVDSAGKINTLCAFGTSDAAIEHSRMTQSSKGDFYGTSFNGGQSGLGSLYTVSPAGVVTHIQDFSQDTGFHPGPDLVEWNNGYFYFQQLFRNAKIKSSTVQWEGMNFCGTTSDGGEHGNGTVFRVTSDGRLATLVSFTGTQGKNRGSAPNSLIPGADGNLYGTTAAGGPADKGTVFRVRTATWLLTASSYHEMHEILPALPISPIVSP